MTSNIIGVKLQKLIMDKKIPIEKINYSLDTSFQDIYSKRTDEAPHETNPETIWEEFHSQSINYLLLLYDFMDRAPSGSHTRTKTVWMNQSYTSSGNIMFNRTNVEELGTANQFNSMYCYLGFFDVMKNRCIINSILWADQ